MSRRSFTAATATTLSATMVHSSLAANEETQELRLGIKKDSPVNGTSAPVFRLMSDS